MYIYTASPILKPTLTRLLAIVGSELTLECPYELGTASDHINPYHHIWVNTDDAIPGEFSRTLTISITRQSPDVTTYTCALRMRECSACGRVVEYPSLNTPQFQLTKVGKFIYLCIMMNESLCTISLQFHLFIPMFTGNCTAPAEPTNGTITATLVDGTTVNYDSLNNTVLEGTVLTYQCDNVLTMFGSVNITCTSDGEWSSDPDLVECSQTGKCKCLHSYTVYI